MNRRTRKRHHLTPHRRNTTRPLIRSRTSPRLPSFRREHIPASRRQDSLVQQRHEGEPNKSSETRIDLMGTVGLIEKLLGHPLSKGSTQLVQKDADGHLESNENVPIKDRKRVQLMFVSSGKGRSGRGSHAMALMRGMLPLPPRVLVRTRFNVEKNIVNVGVPFCNIRFNPCYCYDVDPTLGSTSMPFFSEILTIYRYYRTIKSTIRVNFVNGETFPVTCYVVPVNFDPTANSTSYQNYLSNPTSKKTLLAPTGDQNRGHISHHATTAAFAGSRWLGDEDFYSSAGSTAPQNSWYWMVGILGSVNLVSGVYVSIDIDISFVAFEEASPST